MNTLSTTQIKDLASTELKSQGFKLRYDGFFKGRKFFEWTSFPNNFNGEKQAMAMLTFIKEN